MMVVRNATIDDAEAACDVLRRSIRELCTEDHHDDPDILVAWLANKTVDKVRHWITIAHVVVADEAGAVRGVAAIQDDGEVTLNYVAPEARWRGVSKALVAALEAWARDRGLDRCTLHSTTTARRFYATVGYRDCGPPGTVWGGVLAYPMAKPLR